MIKSVKEYFVRETAAAAEIYSAAGVFVSAVLRGPVKVKLANDWLSGWAVNFKWLHMTWHEEFIISILVKKSLRGVLIACRRRWYKPSRRFMFTHNWTHWQFQKKLFQNNRDFSETVQISIAMLFTIFDFRLFETMLWCGAGKPWADVIPAGVIQPSVSRDCLCLFEITMGPAHFIREKNKGNSRLWLGWWWLG